MTYKLTRWQNSFSNLNKKKCFTKKKRDEWSILIQFSVLLMYKKFFLIFYQIFSFTKVFTKAYQSKL